MRYPFFGPDVCYSPARCARQVSQLTAWDFFNANPVARSVKMTRFGQ